MSILSLNAASSSLKFGLYSESARQHLLRREIDWPRGNRDEAGLLVQAYFAG